MNKILFIICLIVQSQSYSATLTNKVSKGLNTKLETLVQKLNLFYKDDVTLNYSCEDWSYADFDNNQISFCETACKGSSQACLFIVAHEYIHLILDRPILDSPICSDSRFFETKFGKVSNQELDDLYQVQHMNANVIALKSLLALNYKVTKSDIRNTFKKTNIWLSSLNSNNQFDRAIKFNTFNEKRVLKSLSEGLNSNDYYIKIGLVSGYEKFSKAFKRFPRILIPFNSLINNGACHSFAPSESLNEREYYLDKINNAD